MFFSSFFVLFFSFAFLLLLCQLHVYTIYTEVLRISIIKLKLNSTIFIVMKFLHLSIYRCVPCSFRLFLHRCVFHSLYFGCSSFLWVEDKSSCIHTNFCTQYFSACFSFVHFSLYSGWFNAEMESQNASRYFIRHDSPSKLK